ncbi:gluconate:H+ symporter [Flavihumibacter sediminis]|nr:gluconate:H+ symporter [Flavihumibacter sediminis]
MKRSFSIHPFIAFLLVSVAVGIIFGLPLKSIAGSLEKGIGDIMSALVILLVCGAMFGKIIAETGAAQRIATAMIAAVGVKHIQWAMMAIGFIIGIPLFYGVGFVLLVPLLFSVCYSSKISPVYAGLPMLAALSVTHGFLPPHPSPSALVVQFGADMSLTLIFGLIIAIPAILIAGPLLARFLKNMDSKPLAAFVIEERPVAELPGIFNSFFTALLPVLLLVTAALLTFLWPVKGAAIDIVAFLGSPSIVLLFSLVYAGIALGISRGMSMAALTAHCGSAVVSIAPILLIIAGSGALKQVLTDTGLSQSIATALNKLPLNPLVLGWLMAAIIRAVIGSATVAGLTTAGIMTSYATESLSSPSLMVLAVGAGSLAFSHVNDAGFWMYKEYFNLTMKQTLLSWSVMETIVAIVGLIGVLILNFILH